METKFQRCLTKSDLKMLALISNGDIGVKLGRLLEGKVWYERPGNGYWKNEKKGHIEHGTKLSAQQLKTQIEKIQYSTLLV